MGSNHADEWITLTLLDVEHMEVNIPEDDLKKLQNLKEVPTDIESLEQQIRMGTEGRNAFDAVGIFMGADDPEIEGMLQRTNLQSVEENLTVAQCLYLAKFGMRNAWVRVKGETPQKTEDWEMPELKQMILWIIKGRPSVNGVSREQAKEAIQGLKVKLNAQTNPLSGL